MVLALLNGASLSDSFREGMYVLVVTFMFLIVFLPLASWAIHQAIELKKVQRERVPSPRVRTTSKPYPIPMNTKGKPMDTMQDKLERAFARAGKRMRDAGERLSSAPPPRPMQGKFAQHVKPIDTVRAISSPEVSLADNIYRVTHYFYGKKVRRDDFQVFGEGWQGMYADFKRYWNDVFHWVILDGQKTVVGWRFEEHEMYKNDRGLKWAAERNGFHFPEEAGQ